MKKKDITISILIPVYNVEKYVEDCIKSILSQIDNRASVLIMNDASTDSSAAIIQAYSNHPQIEFFEAPSNRGLSATRNALFNMTTTDYVWFIDSDDLLYENAYLSVMSQLIELNSDVLCADYVSLRGNSEVRKKGFIGEPNKIFFNAHNRFLDNVIRNNSNHVWNKVFRKTVIKDTPFKEGLNFEDIYFITDVSAKEFSYSYLQKPVIKYREREGSILKNLNKKYVDDYLLAFIYRVKKYQVMNEGYRSSYLLYKVYKRYVGLIKKIADSNQLELLKYTNNEYSSYFSELYSHANSKLPVYSKLILKIKKLQLEKILKARGL